MSAAPTAIWQVVVNRRHDIPQIFTTFTVIVHQLPVMHSYVGTACWGLSQSSHDEYQAKNIWVTHQHMLNRMTEQIHPLGTETVDLVPPIMKISVLRSSKWPRNAKQPFGRQMFKLGFDIERFLGPPSRIVYSRGTDSSFSLARIRFSALRLRATGTVGMLSLTAADCNRALYK